MKGSVTVNSSSLRRNETAVNNLYEEANGCVPRLLSDIRPVIV